MKRMGPLFAWSIFTVLVAGSASTSMALEPFAGFEEIPWGASSEDIRKAEKRQLDRKNGLAPDFLAFNAEASLVGMTVAPPVTRIVYKGPYSEWVHYYLIGDELTGVVHKPGTNISFRPHKILKGLKEVYGETPKETKTIAYPSSWGNFDADLEFPLTLDWESDKGRVRATTRVWTPLDIRQVFAVMYSSTEMNKKAEARLAAIEAARKKAAAEAAAAAASPAPVATP